jgi:fucose 4-O-acetylase-like acetyltransferase
LVASILVFAALHYFFDETMDLNLRVYGEVVVSTLQAISGIFIVVELSRIFSRVTALGPALANVGVSSLFILIFHASIQSRFFYSSLHFVQNKYLLGVASLVAGVVFPIILLEIFKRNKFLSVWLLPKKSLGSKRSKFACSS